jgi:hypothetical protein
LRRRARTFAWACVIVAGATLGVVTLGCGASTLATLISLFDTVPSTDHLTEQEEIDASF